jgi:hypothetical protein
LGADAYICVSDDYELGYPYSIPFAGFDSCMTGNPLAVSKNRNTSWPHACPIGYTRHLLAVDGSCEINFCVKAGSFNQHRLLPPRLPPFRKRKQMNPNATDTLVIFGNHGTVWYRNEDGEWVRDYGEMPNSRAFLTNFETIGPSLSGSSDSSSSDFSSDSLSNGSVAGISISATLALCTIIAFLVFTSYSIKKKRDRCRKSGEETYLHINEDPGTTYNSQESNA